MIDALRLADCKLRERPAWRVDPGLEAAAAAWAHGATLHDAIARSGYQAAAVSGLHLDKLEGARSVPLTRVSCQALGNRALTDMGTHVRGGQAWLLLAQPLWRAAAGDVPALAARVVVLANEARSRGHRCGRRVWPATTPLVLAHSLSAVAQAHADDMARQGYFEHRNRAGRSPGERVRAAGHAGQRVGENIAYGPAGAEEVVAGWLHSPGHCENLMDPHFREMGLGLATGRGERPGPYWVQDFAGPR